MRISPSSPNTFGTRRQRWCIRGQVQGVGFRPFVYRLAQCCRLSGFIRNDSAGVVIEVQGSDEQLAEFSRQLKAEHPPLAVFQDLSCQVIPPSPQELGFAIQDSQVSWPRSSQRHR